MRTRFFTGPVVKMLVVAAAVLALGIYMLVGARLPPPRESNRVTSRVGGYSIVRPEGWEARPAYAAKDRKYKDSIELRPESSKGGVEPRIFVGRFRAEP